MTSPDTTASRSRPTISLSSEMWIGSFRSAMYVLLSWLRSGLNHTAGTTRFTQKLCPFLLLQPLAAVGGCRWPVAGYQSGVSDGVQCRSTLNTEANACAQTGVTSATVMFLPVRRASDVTPRSGMPQG